MQARHAQGCAPPLLEVREQQLDAEGHAITDANGALLWQPALATGSDGLLHPLTSAYLVPDGATIVEDAVGNSELKLQFDAEGASLLQQISTRDLGQPLAFFYQGELVSAPVVASPLDTQVIVPGFEARVAAVAAALNASVACAAP
jgi:preprotein translocase subunit SecD